MNFRNIIQFFIYTLLPVGCLTRGFYLYETTSWENFRAHSYMLGLLAWIIFLIIIFLPHCTRILSSVPLLGKGLIRFGSYEHELTAVFTWLAFMHTLFILISLRDSNAAFASITNLQSTWSWGALAAITGLIAGVTTNDFSRRKLNTFWHYTRPLIFVTFLLGSVHVALLYNGWTTLLKILGAYIIIRLTAWRMTMRSER